MAKSIKLEINNLKKLHDVNHRLVSYNVEMTEVTGGTVELAPGCCTFFVL
mgnify:CR=1 FL=1